MAATTQLVRTDSANLAARPFDVGRVREDFPILKQCIRGKPLVYLDNAATTQKPQSVIDALSRFYVQECSNVHRGVHLLSERATVAYEDARVKVRRFLNVRDAREIIFVRGTTEAINLIAHSYVRQRLREGDEIVISAMEHHSNIVPWQMVCEERGARLRVAPINERGELILEEFDRLLNTRTKFVSVVHVSNVLGTVNPVREIIQVAHRRGIPVLLDGAQAVPHLKVDVSELDCDFYAFSGHKLFGPTGIGVLYGKAGLLESMPPYQGGGDMISSVSFEKTLYNTIPYKFEAGTPNIAGTVGLGAALDYLDRMDGQGAATHEQALLRQATAALAEIPGVRIIGTASAKVSVVSFVVEAVHAHDIGTFLDQEGVAVRTGHHCAQPLMERFGVPATVRASLAFYNTAEEVEALVVAVRKAKEFFS